MQRVPSGGTKEDNEASVQQSVEINGTDRRKKGRDKSVLYRCTQERKDQLARLAQRLSLGRPADEPVTYTDTINRALDALEEKLGTKQ